MLLFVRRRLRRRSLRCPRLRRHPWLRRSRRRIPPLLLPCVEFGLLVLLVLRILPHRRRWPHQRMCVLRCRRIRHRMLTHRLRLTSRLLRLRGSGAWNVWRSRRTIVRRVRRNLRVRSLIGLHRRRLRSRCFSWSSRGLPRSRRLRRRSGYGLRLCRSLRAHVRLRSVPLSEGLARRRWLPGRDHLAVRERGRWPYVYRPTRSNDTLTDRLRRNAVDHGSIFHLSRIHSGEVPLNWTSVHECVM